MEAYAQQLPAYAVINLYIKLYSKKFLYQDIIPRPVKSVC